MTKEIRSFLTLSLLYIIVLLFVSGVTVVIGGVVNAGTRLPFTHLPVTRRPGQAMLAFAEAKRSEPVDVLFVGSSHSYRTFDPRFFDQFGLTTFNLGSSAQTPLSAYYVVPRYLDRLRPKLVIIEAFWSTLQGPGIEGALVLVNNLPFSSDLVRLSIATGELRVVNSLIARAARELVSPYREWEAELGRSDTYAGRGFVEKSAAYRREGGWQVKGISTSNRQLDYLSRLVKAFRDMGSKVIVVVVPIPAESLESIENYSEVHATMQSWADSNSVPYLDFNTTLKLPRSEYFFDTHHLNQEGVVAFLSVMHRELCNRALWKPVDAQCEGLSARTSD